MGIRIDDPSGLPLPSGLGRAVARHLRAHLDARCASVICATQRRSPQIDWGNLSLDEFPREFDKVVCCGDAAARTQAALLDRPSAASSSE